MAMNERVVPALEVWVASGQKTPDSQVSFEERTRTRKVRSGDKVGTRRLQFEVQLGTPRREHAFTDPRSRATAPIDF